jgi:hypothetical protein
MKYLGSTKIFSGVNVAASGVVPFTTNFSAAGVVLYVVTSNKTGTPNFTFGLNAANPDGTSVGLITSPAVVDTNTVTKLAALPGVTAVANVIANDVIPGQGVFTYTRAAGSYNLDVWAAFFQ